VGEVGGTLNEVMKDRENYLCELLYFLVASYQPPVIIADHFYSSPSVMHFLIVSMRSAIISLPGIPIVRPVRQGHTRDRTTIFGADIVRTRWMMVLHGKTTGLRNL
jgi:hypothetical protein